MASPAATGHRARLGIRLLWPRTIGLRGLGRAADAGGPGRRQAFLYANVRGAPRADDADDRGREARAERDIDAGCALGPLRPGAPGVAGYRRRPRPGSVPAVQGTRAGRLLRGARGQGILPRVVADRLRLGFVAARVSPGSFAGAGRRDRQRVAGARAADRGRARLPAAGPR